MKPGFLKKFGSRSAIALILLALFFISFFTSSLILFAFFLLAYGLLINELVNIVSVSWPKARSWKVFLMTIPMISLVFYFSLLNDGLSEWISSHVLGYPINKEIIVFFIASHIAFFWGIFFVSFLFFSKKNGPHAKSMAIKWLIRWFTIIYTAILFAILLFPGASGESWLLRTLFYVWVFDTFSYLGGNALGGPRLFPKTSPKKTISGALCGLLSVLIFSWLLKQYNLTVSLSYEMVHATLVCCAALWGDWYASRLKRAFNVKDSGRLLREHGGVLDRLDSSIGVLSLGGLCFFFYLISLAIIFSWDLSI